MKYLCKQAELSNKISVYPNPSKDIINVSENKNSIKQLIIKDLLRNLIFEAEQNTVDVSNFLNGSYFVTEIDGLGITILNGPLAV